MNRFSIFQHRVRNTSMRILVFNNIGKSLRGKILEILTIKENLLMGNYEPLKTFYYDMSYYYYSLPEDDRENFEFMFSLLL